MDNAVRHNSIYSQVIRELRGALVALWWSSRILIPKMQGETTHTSSFVGQNSVDNLYMIFIFLALPPGSLGSLFIGFSTGRVPFTLPYL